MLVPRTSTRPSVYSTSAEPAPISMRADSNRTKGSAPSGGAAIRGAKRVSPSAARMSSGRCPALVSSAPSRSASMLT